MRVTIVLVAFFAAAWPFPQTKNNWKDFPMKRIFVEPSLPKDPKYHPEVRIVNGQEVTPHEIPYQVWLVLRNAPGASGSPCGGSLITKRFVLTAAHCLYGAGLAEVYVGAHDVSAEEPERIKIVTTKLISHPDFSVLTNSNDVGLIDLEQELELNDVINTVSLPRRGDSDNLYEAANVRVSGWGTTAGDANRSNVLLAVNSTILPNSKCKDVFSQFLDNEICFSGEGGVGACSGDSGGPLVAGDTQIGIVSYGSVGCLTGYPTVFVRITSFLDWIEDNSDYVVED